MHRALKHVVIVSTLVALQACGGPSTGEVAESGKGGVQCEDLPSYTCDEYPEQCRPDEADVLFLGLQCYGETGLAFACSERSECVEAEWFAEVGPDTYVVRGCINHQRSGMTVVSEPSDEMVAAAATPCDERLRLLDENCRMFTGDACPIDEGCRVETGQVLDPERGCATGETSTECVGVTILAPPEMFEFLPCD